MKHIFKNVVFALMLFIGISSVLAQTPPPPKNSDMQRWFCLKPVRSGMHSSSLTVKEGVIIDPTRPTYVVAKIAFAVGDTNPGEKTSAMTTGKSDLDTHVFNSTQGLLDLQQKLGFNGGVSQGSNPTSSFPVIWTDDLSKTSGAGDERAHFWYGMQESNPTSFNGNGGLGSQQQGTFTFDKAKSANDCTFISWDPFGYVFDAVTHGPIQGVYVRILTSATENGTYIPVPVGIGAGKVSQNPVVTNIDGSYKFYVDPGYYKLELMGDVSGSSTKYIIEKNSANITPGYEQFGYEQIYIANSPEVIHETAGKVERRDIAIQTIGAPAPFAKSGPTFQELFFNRSIQAGEAKVRISGRALFIPIDIIAQYTDINGALVEQKTTSLVHGHSYVPQNSTDERNFDIWLNEKSTDGKGALTKLKVTSRYSDKSISVPVDPMPSYLEGIAQDSAGKPIVEGRVKIYPIGSNKPAFKTVTDKSGYFIVNSDELPPLPYSLVYTTITGDEYPVSAATYLKQNQVYHATHAIDSFAVKAASPSSEMIQSLGKNQKGQFPLPTLVVSQAVPIGRSSGVPAVIVVLISLLLLFMIGVGAFVVMKTKQPPTVA